VLRTGSDLLIDRQRQRLTAVFATEQHVEVEATWGVYQRIVAAYRNHDRAAAKTELKRIIATITAAVPTALTELITLGRTLNVALPTCWAQVRCPGDGSRPSAGRHLP
jgi:transposase